MSVEHRPTRPAQPPAPAAAPEQEDQRGLGDRNWVLCVGVLVATLLVFAAMIAITALAGGDGFPN